MPVMPVMAGIVVWGMSSATMHFGDISVLAFINAVPVLSRDDGLDVLLLLKASHCHE